MILNNDDLISTDPICKDMMSETDSDSGESFSHDKIPSSSRYEGDMIIMLTQKLKAMERSNYNLLKENKHLKNENSLLKSDLSNIKNRLDSLETLLHEKKNCVTKNQHDLQKTISHGKEIIGDVTQPMLKSNTPDLNKKTAPENQKNLNEKKKKIGFNQSFAQIVKSTGTQKPHGLEVKAPKNEALLKLIKPFERIKPVSFSKLYLKLNTIPALRVGNNRSRVRIIRNLLNLLQINNKVRDFSFIGKSVLELYVAEPCLDEVTKVLSENGRLLSNFNPNEASPYAHPERDVKSATIKRLAHLYARNHLRMMKEAILSGFPEDIQENVKTEAENLTRKMFGLPELQVSEVVQNESPSTNTDSDSKLPESSSDDEDQETSDIMQH
jgi:hypothetical protein